MITAVPSPKREEAAGLQATEESSRLSRGDIMLRFLILLGMTLLCSLSVAHGNPELFGVQPGMSPEAAIASLKRLSPRATVEAEKSGSITIQRPAGVLRRGPADNDSVIVLTLGSVIGKKVVTEIEARTEAYPATSEAIAKLRKKYGHETLVADTNQDLAADAVDTDRPHDTLAWLYDAGGKLVRWPVASTCLKRAATAIAKQGTVALSRDCAFRFLVVARLRYEIRPRDGTVNPNSVDAIVQDLSDPGLAAAKAK